MTTTQDQRLAAEAHEAAAIALDASADASAAATKMASSPASSIPDIPLDSTIYLYSQDPTVCNGAKQARVGNLQPGTDLEAETLRRFGGGRWKAMATNPKGQHVTTLYFATVGPSLLAAELEAACPGSTSSTDGDDLLSRIRSLRRETAAPDEIPAWAKTITAELAELKAGRKAEPSPLETLQLDMLKSMLQRQTDGERQGGKQGNDLKDLSTNIEQLKGLQDLLGGDSADGTPAWMPAFVAMMESLGVPLVHAYINNQNAQAQRAQQLTLTGTTAPASPAGTRQTPPPAPKTLPKPTAKAEPEEDNDYAAEKKVVLNHVARCLAAESDEDLEEEIESAVSIAMLLMPDPLLDAFGEQGQEQASVMLAQLITSEVDEHPELAKLIRREDAQPRVEALATALQTAIRDAERDSPSVVKESKGQGDKEAAEQPGGVASGGAANEVTAETVTDAG